MSSPVEQIKERLSIVDLVGTYVKLERSGANFRACCPFHQEKTPSFFVSPTRNNYHCFGCGRSGDIFSFVEEAEGLSFREALVRLAERTGVELKDDDRGERAKRARLKKALDLARDFFVSNLVPTHPAYSYLTDRGLKVETIRAYNLGFAGSSADALTKKLVSAGFSFDEIEVAGLAFTAQGRMVDRFRDRIMFPLADGEGNVVGFTGRIFGPLEKKEGIGKYVNSPETPLFSKSKILYGFDKAKSAIMKKNRALLVEGQMDLLASHQAGLTEAVAVSGTALSEFHLKTLLRLAGTLVFALDADAAGFRAAERGIGMALSLGAMVRVAILPAGEDPASLARGNADALKNVVEKAEFVIPAIFSFLQSQFPDEALLRRKSREHLFPLLAKLDSEIERTQAVNFIAKALGVRDDDVRADFVTFVREEKSTSGQTVIASPPEGVSQETSRLEKIKKELIGVVLMGDTDKSIYDLVEKEYARISGSTLEDLQKEYPDKDKNDAAFMAETLYHDSKLRLSVARELLSEFEREMLREKMKKLMAFLKNAEITKKEENTEEILVEIQRISSEIEKLNDKIEKSS